MLVRFAPSYPADEDACHNPPLGTEGTMMAEFCDGGEGLMT